MSLERTMDEIEKQLDYANSYLIDLREEIGEELEAVNEEIVQLKETIKAYEEDADTADTQIQELLYQNSMLNIELAEVTGQLIHMRHELELSRKGI